MNQKMRMISGGQGLGAMAIASAIEEPVSRAQAPAAGPAWPGPEAIHALEKVKASLVFAYLNSNLNAKGIPLKSFLDDIEKKILLACLRLTLGSQKNAAALINLKPTALFEKMRKHGIRSQRGRLPGRPGIFSAGDGDN
jgi:transcriptional regulator of acetoin/glycerol metabolism